MPSIMAGCTERAYRNPITVRIRSMKPRSRSSARSLALSGSLACAGGLLIPSETSAFCGFYVAGADAKLFNNATVVVLMRDGTRTVLSMQNDYQGPPEDFALVIPVPVVLHEADVKILRRELFDRVETLASPRLVEYWEQDPCTGIGIGSGGGTGSGYGTGSGAGFGGRGGGGPTVTVEAQFAVGEYDIVILSATESSGLDSWLRENDYNIPAGAEPLLRPYVQQDMKFFVAKVDPMKVGFDGNGRAKLSPLRFHYDSKDFVLPVRLGLINVPEPSADGQGGKQDLLIHILAPGTRYQVANYPNVTIPTNLDLTDTAKQSFGEFYVSLFDHTLAQNPGAVVTEYAWGAGSCDPCPGPAAALTNQELLELGGDVLPNWSPGLSTMSMGSVPQVRQEQAIVEGPLDQDIIRRIVRAHINEVRACYNQGLVKNPQLSGRVVVDFTIAATGKVESSAVGSTTLTDATVSKCVAKAAKRWTYPKPSGASVTVSYPFMLSPGGGVVSASPGAFVLTRLHARYDATSLGEDLVFETAPPITGGREVRGSDGKLEQGATVIDGGLDNFQGRYAIRHLWAGEIACEQPVRGRWGAPPDGAPPQPTLARESSEVTRGASLGSFITAAAGEQIGVAAAAVIDVPPREAKETPEPAPAPTEEKAEKAPANTTPGCACSSPAEPERPVASLGLLALLGLRRRRQAVC
jgi:MYXO-CTERM domain-containing protein